MTFDDETSIKMKEEGAQSSAEADEVLSKGITYREIEIKIEKYNWESYLKLLKGLVKLSFLKRNGQSIPNKLKKSKTLQSYVEFFEVELSLGDLVVRLVGIFK